jgi:phage shock protein A
MAAFERMEEKVLMQEAKSQAAGEIAGSQLEQQFQLLEAHSDVDDELAQMKAMLAGGSQPTGALPPGQASSTPKPTAPVDEELEALRRQLNQ